VELEAALRLILSTARGPADDDQILDFLQFAAQRKIDLQALRIVEEAGELRWVILPMVSPGRTMMLFSPALPPTPLQQPAAHALIDHLLMEYAQRDIHLAQALLDPRETSYHALYRAHGFWDLAELVYLQKPVRGPQPPPAPPPGFQLHTYGPQTEGLFKRIILASYRQSLDCPRLAGLRHIDDIVAGHQATGEFDPGLWFALTQGGKGRGVLLLSRTPRSDAMELVYLGLAPEARGLGLGRWMMRQAIASTAATHLRSLCLAVDSLNTPALRLYYGLGMTRIGSRLALLRDLRREK
jgi:GNAT superfamily N-acetyltransferase